MICCTGLANKFICQKFCIRFFAQVVKEKYFMFGDVEMVTNYKIKVDIGKGRFYSNTNAKFDSIY